MGVRIWRNCSRKYTRRPQIENLEDFQLAQKKLKKKKRQKTRDPSSYSEFSFEKCNHPFDRDDLTTNPTTQDASPPITSTPKKQGAKAWLSLTACFMGMLLPLAGSTALPYFRPNMRCTNHGIIRFTR